MISISLVLTLARIIRGHSSLTTLRVRWLKSALSREILLIGLLLHNLLLIRQSESVGWRVSTTSLWLSVLAGVVLRVVRIRILLRVCGHLAAGILEVSRILGRLSWHHSLAIPHRNSPKSISSLRMTHLVGRLSVEARLPSNSLLILIWRVWVHHWMAWHSWMVPHCCHISLSFLRMPQIKKVTLKHVFLIFGLQNFPLILFNILFKLLLPKRLYAIKEIFAKTVVIEWASELFHSLINHFFVKLFCRKRNRQFFHLIRICAHFY